MANSARTGSAIIASVLARIGNPTITTEAQQALANIVQRLNEDYNWPFNKSSVSATILSGATSTSLPSDFADLWDRNAANLIDSTTNARIVLEAVSQQEFDTYSDITTTGTPSRILLNLASRTFRLWRVPNKNYTYELVYKALPTRITNFALVIPFPNDALVEQMLFVWACQYEDDDRYAGELAVANQLLHQYLKQFNFGTTKNARMAYNPNKFSSMQNLR